MNNWHRRHAVQVVAALPEETEDALKVLDLARQLVESFLSEDQRLPALERDGERRLGAVVSLSSSISGSNR